MRSPARAKEQPTPAAGPLTAVTNGMARFLNFIMSGLNCRSSRSPASRSAAGLLAAPVMRFTPDEKPRPSPVSTIARASRSARARAFASRSAMASEKALSVLGSLRRRTATWPMSSYLTEGSDILFSNPLDDDRRRHSAGGAHRHQTTAQVAPLELIEHRADQDRTCRTDRMAERHRAAIDVHLFAIELQVADELLRYYGEGFIYLEQIDVIEGETGLDENLARRWHRAVEHQGRAIPRIRHGYDPRPGRKAMRRGIGRRRQQQGRRAVDHPGRVAGVVDELNIKVGELVADQTAKSSPAGVDGEVGHGLERRFEAGKPLERRLRSRKFLMVEGQRAVVMIDGHQASAEMPASYGARGTLLALVRQCIEILTRNFLERGDGVGANTLIRLRVERAQMQIPVVEHIGAIFGAAARGGERHHLGTAGDDQILEARHDRGCRHVDRGDAGSAEAIECHAACALVIAGIERRHATQIVALLASLRVRTPDDVVHLRGVDAGALRKRLEDGRAEAMRMDVGERSFSDLTDSTGRAARIDDERVSHAGCPIRVLFVASGVSLSIDPLRSTETRS